MPRFLPDFDKLHHARFNLVTWMYSWFDRKSRSLIAFLDVRMEMLIVSWIGVTGLIALVKALMVTGPNGLAETFHMMLPYLLAAAAPVAGYRVAAGSFPRGLISALPSIRLCRLGRWRSLGALDAARSPCFGPTGFMASLTFGVLLNVPVRTLEFLVAIPAMPAGAPDWAVTMQWVMAADVVIMNFFYMVCFVMALRAVPLFPRMLVFAWIADISLQFVIAERIVQEPRLPVEVASALSDLLQGNLQKVMISVLVWLPYLILSERVNVTFRRRAPA